MHPRIEGDEGTPALAVFELASCDGCLLTLLDCEDELLALTARVKIVHFPEAGRAVLPAASRRCATSRTSRNSAGPSGTGTHDRTRDTIVARPHSSTRRGQP